MSPPPKNTARRLQHALPVINDTASTIDDDAVALAAPLPEAVLHLSAEEQQKRVRKGHDTVLLDDVDNDGKRTTRGFVRAVLRVPLTSPHARVYGVFVEVDRKHYAQLQHAFAHKTATTVPATLATRLPFLDDAFGCDVTVLEDGSDLRARVVDSPHLSLREGPALGHKTHR